MLQSRNGLFLAATFLLTWPLAEARGQEATTVWGAVHVLGLEPIHQNAKGRLMVQSGALRFKAGTTSQEVTIAAIQDVLTGEDSQRMVRGTLGTLSMFAPYGGGRFLSLFRKKVDVITLEYRDNNGGLHGAIFLLPQGQAAAVKKQLVALGARTSIPVEEEAQPAKKPEKKP